MVVEADADADALSFIDGRHDPEEASEIGQRMRSCKANSKRNLRIVARLQPAGASLVLVIAIFGALAMAILLFCLGFVGQLGSYHEQRSAIEASALAAIKDLSAIVIDDPNFGLIGLSDSAPTGKNTAARDGYYTSVTGINTLFGTIRLDMIIADALQDPIMTQLATTDYKNALSAQKNLLNTLNSACLPDGTGTDIDGNTLNPMQDAISAYNANNVHLAIGQASSLVAGSLKLTLGYVDNLGSRTPVPQPQNMAGLTSSDQQTQGFYASDMAISYTTSNTGATFPFVFAALGPGSRLVDSRAFQSSLQGLAYSTPTVIKVDADEVYVQNTGGRRTVHATAAAVAGTIVDQRPYPGAFTITFPDGPVPEIVQFAALINNAQLQGDPADFMQTPTSGDYPQTALSQYSMSFLPDADSAHPQFEHVLSVALYDWLRRGGTNINVQSLITTIQTPMQFTGSGGQIQMFHLTSSGNVTNDSASWGQTDLGVSNKQYRATSGLGIVSANKNSYDLQITDNGRIPGRTNGGLHAGEPLNNPGNNGTNPNSGSYVPGGMFENTTWSYLEYLTGSNAVRPTYNKEGIAVDFTIRMRH
jgi:hypothetical protein